MRRRADSPLGAAAHEHPAKRVRRESESRSLSPSASFQQQPPQQQARPANEDTSPRVISKTSPSGNSIPALHPLPLLQPGERDREAQSTSEADERRDNFQSFSAAGQAAQASQPPARGSWAPKWPTSGHRSRHSIDTPVVNLKSPSPPVTSPSRKGERTTEPPQASSEIVFTRDVTNRQPRSMMACMRCRRQKMKCDGPGKEPCRGCRQAGVPCVFDSRTRPKSISTLPTRASPFFGGPMTQGRGGTPGAGPSFYPMTPQAAPPITSRPPMMPDYAMRQPPREGMHHQSKASISSLSSVAAPYPPPLRTHSPPPLHAPGQPGAPPPPQPYYGHPGPPPPGAPGYGGPPPGPPQQMQPAPPPLDPRTDGRLRHLEQQLKSVSTLPAAVAGIQATLNSLLRSQDVLSAQLSGSQPPPSAGAGPPPTSSAGQLRAAADVPEHVWESYRVGAWPLTPWLPGISPLPGLPGLVLSCLGKRAAIERTEATRREGAQAAEAIVTETSRLLGSRVPWTRDEVLSIGVYSTWTSDPALGCLAVGLARDLQLDRPHNLRKSHDEWREWIYVVLADHMLHLPDFNVPIVHEPLSAHWRELVVSSTPTDQSTRDRDTKLLAWLEFSEILIEIQQLQRALDTPLTPESRTSESADPTSKDRSRSHDIWRRFASKLEAWAGASGARHDPVLSLHFNYAILYCASPAFCANERVWEALAQSHDGYTQLERGRDAAFAVLQTLASPEIGRTLGYSFPVVRPFFGLAITHLVNLVSNLSHTPIISLPHVQSVLRNVVETLAESAPLDSARGDPSTSPLPPSLLVDMVESGAVVQIGKREVAGAEPGRDLWRRLLG